MGLPLLFIGSGVFSRAAPRGRTSFPDSFTHRGRGTPTYPRAVKTVAGGAETTTASTTFFFYSAPPFFIFLTTFLSSCRFSSPSLRSFYEFVSRSAVSEPIQRLDERKEREMVVQARFLSLFLIPTGRKVRKDPCRAAQKSAKTLVAAFTTSEQKRSNRPTIVRCTPRGTPRRIPCTTLSPFQHLRFPCRLFPRPTPSGSCSLRKRFITFFILFFNALSDKPLCV